MTYLKRYKSKGGNEWIKKKMINEDAQTHLMNE